MSRESLKSIDQFIKLAKFGEAQEALDKVNSKNLSRIDLVLYANLARRLGKMDDAILALRPFVRPKARDQIEATEDERLEYAMALIKIGAVNEGLKLLHDIDGNEHPNKYLYSAFARITEWNYQEAALLLESYTQNDKIDSYSDLTARVNLLSCYLFEGQNDKASILIDYLLEKTSDNSLHRLRKNVLHLASQLCIQSRKFEEAKKFLDKATASDEKSNSTIDQLLLNKWQVIWSLHKNGPSSQIMMALDDIKIIAEDLNNYETIRDVDYYLGIYFNQHEVLKQLYFGTPYANFRKKILHYYEKINGKSLHLPDVYNFEFPKKFEPEDEASNSFIQVADGVNSYSDSYLPPGKAMQQLLGLVVKDTYRPLTIHQIHNELFDESFYNPNSTPKKIKQLIYRLSHWFEENSIPLELVLKKNFVTLVADKPIALRIQNTDAVDPKIMSFLMEVKEIFGSDSFSSRDISVRLEKPIRTTTKHLKIALDNSLIEKIGAGPNTKFKIIANI